MLEISNKINSKHVTIGALIVLSLLATTAFGAFLIRKSQLVSASTSCDRVLRALPSDIMTGIDRNKADYVAVSNATGVPWELLAGIHYRETSFSRSNPSNGYGIFQFTPPPKSYPPGPVSDAEFRSQLTYMANRIQDDYVNRSGLSYQKRKLTQNETEIFRIKDVLFSYNGRAAVYADQAASYGYSKTATPYEGSPYVMNMFDCQRSSMGIITKDYGGIDGQDTRYGAFTLYARLKGDAFWKSLQNDKVTKMRFEQIVGSSSSVVRKNSQTLGEYTKTVTTNDGKIYTFYSNKSDKQLNLLYWNGKKWSDTVLDGANSTTGGALRVGIDPGAIEAFNYNGELQVFYYDSTTKSLRHAFTRNGRSSWYTETLHGSGDAVLKSSDAVGPAISGFKYGAEGIQLYYYNQTKKNLVHTWWNGRAWATETLHGTDDKAIIRGAGDVGSAISAFGFGPEKIQLYYYSLTDKSIVHTWWDGRMWRSEMLHGTNNSVIKGTDDVGSALSGFKYGAEGIQLYYFNKTTGELIHTWWNGRAWYTERMDGDYQPRTLFGNYINSGRMLTAKSSGEHIYVFYYDDATLFPSQNRASAWRLGYWDGRRWSNVGIDGGNSSLSGNNKVVGGNLSFSTFNKDSLQIFYQDHTGGLRHAWF